MDTKLWDIWAYFRSTEMYTAERSNENEFRSLPVTVRNVTVHLWSIGKVDIETCVWEKKKKKNSKLFTVDLKTLETIEKLFGKPASSERATWLR